MQMDKLGDLVTIDTSYVSIDTAGAARPSFIALSTVRMANASDVKSVPSCSIPSVFVSGTHRIGRF
jgi:predicted GTPase